MPALKRGAALRRNGSRKMQRTLASRRQRFPQGRLSFTPLNTSFQWVCPVEQTSPAGLSVPSATFLQPNRVKDSLHAYHISRRGKLAPCGGRGGSLEQARADRGTRSARASP